MPEALAAAFALPLVPVLAATALAGLVYGFAGFGAALVFMPIAAALIDPVLAIVAFALGTLSSLVTLVPAAWRQCDRRVTLLMIAAASATLPAGIWLLKILDPEAIRLAVALVAAVTLGALILGMRFTIRPGLGPSVAVAGAAGVMGGATGLLGPIVILFNLATGDGAGRVRANTLIFLTLTSLIVLPQMALQGLLKPEALWLGTIMLPFYGAGSVLGRHLFRPERERAYRIAAYAIIGLAIVTGLPVFDGLRG
ncbi:sulfite exporter TauE/SafE family protein [Ovoidimarina sediminis]|uniref:sulfite exporter TauE/SafE family protein n=1 Tax=Ovoidimarina sediminis TaxID=3079856 RepID=UPI0029105DE9|nr:sulfite exporter TauE/SafE family protein [Rhodophyticola sp. MJ-SS7]MDU8945080.1 sulfite exporter TauE/SafE family protein [Rhodophyticola sp. MJ-SS7]